MRVSTKLLHQQGVDTLLQNQYKVSRTQLQLSTGNRILSPSEDPSGARKVLDLREVIANYEQYDRNMDALVGRLTIEENALRSSTDLLQRARELAVQGLNDSLGDAERDNIALEVRQILDQMLAVANSKDSNGEFVFAGFQSQTQPFVDGGSGTYTYNGDQGQRNLQVSPTRQVALGDSGQDVFMNIPGSSVNTFRAVYNLAVALENNNPALAQLQDIDASLNTLNQYRASVGARMNAVESQRTLNDDVLLQSQTLLSDINDIDVAEAAARLNQELLGLQAAQQTYVRVQGLSLFDLLR